MIWSLVCGKSGPVKSRVDRAEWTKMVTETLSAGSLKGRPSNSGPQRNQIQITVFSVETLHCLPKKSSTVGFQLSFCFSVFFKVLFLSLEMGTNV